MVNRRAMAQIGYAAKQDAPGGLFDDAAIGVGKILAMEQREVDEETEGQRCRRLALQVELLVKVLWRVRTMRRLQERLVGVELRMTPAHEGEITRLTRCYEAEVDESIPLVLNACGAASLADRNWLVDHEVLREDEPNIVLRSE
jgi:hypothetical protein